MFKIFYDSSLSFSNTSSVTYYKFSPYVYQIKAQANEISQLHNNKNITGNNPCSSAYSTDIFTNQQCVDTNIDIVGMETTNTLTNQQSIFAFMVGFDSDEHDEEARDQETWFDVSNHVIFLNIE